MWNVQKQTTLLIPAVLLGQLIYTDTVYSMPWFFKRTASALIKLCGRAVWSGLSPSTLFLSANFRLARPISEIIMHFAIYINISNNIIAPKSLHSRHLIPFDFRCLFEMRFATKLGLVHRLYLKAVMHYHSKPKYWDGRAWVNSADHDQTPLKGASDQSQHCLPLTKQF